MKMGKKLHHVRGEMSSSITQDIAPDTGEVDGLVPLERMDMMMTEIQ